MENRKTTPTVPSSATGQRGNEGRGKTSVDRVYDAVKEMTVAYKLKPEERVNEVAIAKALGASRTPLREALNRLVAERFLDFRPGLGFFCRMLDARQVFELYEVRCMYETEAVRLACARASDEDLLALENDPDLYNWQVYGQPIQELVGLDELFHMRIASMAGNRELMHRLERINERIRFIRWLDMDKKVQGTKSEHMAIASAMRARDVEGAVAAMRDHISRRKEQIDAVVREGFSTIYMNELDDPAADQGPA